MSQAGSFNQGGSNITVPVTVPNGGTGQVTLPAHTVLIGEGTSAIGNAGPGAVNSILMGQGAGADPIFGTLVAGSNITLTNGAGTITISSSGGGGAGSIVFTADSASTATTSAGTLNIFGDSASGSSVLGDGIKTITIANVSATTSQKGVLQLATGAQAIAGTDTEDAVTSDALKSKLGTQILNGIAFGNGTSSAIGWTAAGGANTVLLGNGGVPTFGSVPNAALANSSVTLNSGNNITVTGGGPLFLGGVASFNVTGTTNHAVLVGNATASISSLATGTNGQVLIGSTGADPQFGTITSGDGSITISGGAGTLALSVTAGSTTILTITGDSGGALSPTAGNFNILGTAAQGITTAGAGSTLTLSNTDWTTAQKGVGVLSTNAQAIAGSGTTQAVTPAALGAKLGTQTVGGIAFGAGTSSAISWTGTANNGILITNGSGTPSFLANGTTGQVLTATTGSSPSWASNPGAGTITGDSGGALSQTANNWNIIGQKASTVAVMDTIGATSTLSIEDRTWVSQFVVDPSSTSGLRGTYTTIASALADAVSGQTIFIRPGTYTENLTAKDGITLWGGNGFQDRVTIVGKITQTSGIMNITNIKLQTNADYIASTSGGILVFRNCNINITNNTGFFLNGGSITLRYGDGDVGNTGIGIYTMTSGNIYFDYCSFGNSGLSTTASTASAGVTYFKDSTVSSPLSYTSTGTLSSWNSQFYCENLNATALTTAGTATSDCSESFFASGSASAISIGSGTTLKIFGTRISSSNTNAITGAGTIYYAGLYFTNTSSTINTTTQVLTGMGPRIQLDAGAQLMSGSGSPSGSVTAPKGTLYLRTDGSSSATRAYINTNSGTSWTAINTVS